jgi:hypothetical protein
VRTVLAPVIGLLLVLFAQSAYLEWEVRDAVERSRRAGEGTAERDIARGEPTIRMALAGTSWDTPLLTAEGLGIDRTTGLPLENRLCWCSPPGPCLEDAEDAAYNARIRAAHATGRLERYRLDGKLRTREAVAALFAAGASFRLEQEGDSATIPAAACTLVLGEGHACRDVEVRTEDREPRLVHLAYSLVTERRREVATRAATGPFEGVVTDAGTTAVLRDGDGSAWIIDLPRAVVVQYLAR